MTAMRGELLKYQIRAVRRPQERIDLASTVSTTDDSRVGYCYITFSDAFVEFVGKSLPQGVSKLNPAFIEVNFKTAWGFFQVDAVYFRDGRRATLWRTKEKPEWLNFYTRRIERNANRDKAPSGNTDQSGPDSGPGLTSLPAQARTRTST